MKRREFIINSALAIGGTALLTGCGEKKIILSENQIAKRKYKDIEVPLLGLGCMRLPMKGDEVDMQELERMVEYCMQHGANYFDTAYMYVDGKSETAVGKVLKNYNRKDLIIADKSPAMYIKSKDDVRRIFEEQLNKAVLRRTASLNREPLAAALSNTPLKRLAHVPYRESFSDKKMPD